MSFVHRSLTVKLLKLKVSSNDILTTRQLTTRGKKHWGDGGMASVTARIVSRAPGYDRSSKSPTISYRETVTVNTNKVRYIALLA